MSRDDIHQPGNMGDKIADAVTNGMGSWRFIIIQTVIVALWVSCNLIAWRFRWDIYPFILLNLLFSTQAAYSSPLILMSQNRQAAKDRVRDDLEAQEVELMSQGLKLLIKMNVEQTDILRELHEINDCC